MKSSLFSIFFIFSFCIFGQIQMNSETKFPREAISKTAMDSDSTNDSSSEVDSESNLRVIADERLEDFIQSYNEDKQVRGYRIQLFSGTNRKEAAKVRSDFINKYENERPELIYQQPNFKIRVGNYRDRGTAAKFLALYKIDFQSAFIVKDEIVIED